MLMNHELECDQCIVQLIAFGRVAPLNHVDPNDRVCPRCMLRICRECANEHIFCDGTDLTADLAAISRERWEGVEDHALEFFEPEYHVIVHRARALRGRRVIRLTTDLFGSPEGPDSGIAARWGSVGLFSPDGTQVVFEPDLRVLPAALIEVAANWKPESPEQVVLELIDFQFEKTSGWGVV